MTIAADGTITTQLLTAENLAEVTPDAEVKAIEDAWVAELDEQLGQVIGYSQVTLDNYDAEGQPAGPQAGDQHRRLCRPTPCTTSSTRWIWMWTWP